MRAFRIVVLLGAVTTSACVADRASAPGLFALDDAAPGRWRTVSTGATHSCALDDQGRAWCWGSNARFQLGVDRTASTCGAAPEVPCSLVPTPVLSGRAFSSISAGGSHTCAISTDSVPYCWGNNTDGQLGVIGATGPFARVPGTSAMIAISAGTAHSCGIRVDRVLVCWGSNLFGAVGTGIGTRVVPTAVGGAQRFESVFASDHRTCATTVARRVICWGTAWAYSIGDTNFSVVRATPTIVAGLGAMVDVGVGPSSTCSVDATGFVWCWESNVHGEGGIGPGQGTATPRRIATDQAFSSVTVGAAHACGLTVDGDAFCWGSNRNGQLGSLSPSVCGESRVPCSSYPIGVGGRQRFVRISAGPGNHVCGISDRQNLYCWGAGSYGQRGDSSRSSASRVPRLAVDVHRQ